MTATCVGVTGPFSRKIHMKVGVPSEVPQQHRGWGCDRHLHRRDGTAFRSVVPQVGIPAADRTSQLYGFDP